MPLTKKGSKIMSAMTKEYGMEKGKKVFYASKNKGKISGVDKGKRKKGRKLSKQAENSFFGSKHS